MTKRNVERRLQYLEKVLFPERVSPEVTTIVVYGIREGSKKEVVLHTWKWKNGRYGSVGGGTDETD